METYGTKTEVAGAYIGGCFGGPLEMYRTYKVWKVWEDRRPDGLYIYRRGHISHGEPDQRFYNHWHPLLDPKPEEYIKVDPCDI